MTVEEKRLELFEEWLSAQACHGVFMGGYTNEEEEGAWAAFNAALDAVTITLPDTYQVGAIKCDAHQGTLIACRAAIESTGLGLKVLP